MFKALDFSQCANYIVQGINFGYLVLIGRARGPRLNRGHMFIFV